MSYKHSQQMWLTRQERTKKECRRIKCWYFEKSAKVISKKTYETEWNCGNIPDFLLAVLQKFPLLVFYYSIVTARWSSSKSCLTMFRARNGDFTLASRVVYCVPILSSKPIEINVLLLSHSFCIWYLSKRTYT